MSGHGKKATERGALTIWKWQREGLVRIQYETDRARRTHFLETAEEETCQDKERNRLSEVHLLSGDGRGCDLSRHRRKAIERGALTDWRWQRDLSGRKDKAIERGALTNWRREREEFLRTRKERDRARGTHVL